MAGRKKIVDDNYENILKEFSNTYFDKELQHAHDLFSDKAWPADDDANYVKKCTFLINARKAHMMLLKQMATHISGINNANAPDPDRNGEAEKLLKKAMERLQPKKEDTNETVNDGNPVNKDE